MSTPRSWSGGGGRQADKVGWGQKVTEMGWGTDKDKKGKKGGCTMTLPEPLGWVCIYYFRGCQCLWAGPLHSCHILLRGYRLLVPSRLGLITYCIQVSYHFIPFTADKSLLHQVDNVAHTSRQNVT